MSFATVGPTGISHKILRQLAMALDLTDHNMLLNKFVKTALSKDRHCECLKAVCYK